LSALGGGYVHPLPIHAHASVCGHRGGPDTMPGKHRCPVRPSRLREARNR